MSWPVKHLPVIQNWDCHGCGQCCQEYEVIVTDAERERIAAQGWEGDPAIPKGPLFVRTGPRRRGQYRINSKADNTCIFLNDDGRCRIHAKFGSAAKPLACQIYPYVLVPAGDHWRVGVRFACPSAVDNLGRPIKASLDELRSFGQALEEREGIRDRSPLPPALQIGRHVPWADLERFTNAILALLSRRDSPIEYRLRLTLALATLCRQAKFDAVSGNRLTEFLELVSRSLVGETQADPDRIERPSWIGRILFRQAAALYARRDTGPRAGVSSRGRVALLRAAIRFARGRGSVPRVHGLLPDTTFEKLEDPAGPMSSVSEDMLGRYYRVKVESHQFFGPTNFGASYWDGLESLLLTFPVISWLSRAFTDRSRDAAYHMAVRIVDDNFGHNRLLGMQRQRFATRILASRGELAKLIAWYGR
ncbi:MAG: YkgJ family cysteine cluster protein [Gemmataceae bacterium]